MIDCILFSTLKAKCKYYFFYENNVPVISLLKSLALTSLESERFLLSRISNTVSLDCTLASRNAKQFSLYLAVGCIHSQVDDPLLSK